MEDPTPPASLQPSMSSTLPATPRPPLAQDNQELRHLLGQQVGKAELRGLRSVLISLEYACRGMEPTSEHLALLQYVSGELVAGWSSRHPDWRLHPWPAASQAAPGLLAAGSILEPLAELEETVRMGHLLPGEVETQLLELASYQNNIHCTYAKLCGKAGVQVGCLAMWHSWACEVIELAQGCTGRLTVALRNRCMLKPPWLRPAQSSERPAAAAAAAPTIQRNVSNPMHALCRPPCPTGCNGGLAGAGAQTTPSSGEPAAPTVH